LKIGRQNKECRKRHKGKERSRKRGQPLADKRKEEFLKRRLEGGGGGRKGG